MNRQVHLVKRYLVVGARSRDEAESLAIQMDQHGEEPDELQAVAVTPEDESPALVLDNSEIEARKQLMRQIAQWHLGDPAWGDVFAEAMDDPMEARQRLIRDKAS